jgi:hypothetical protein
VATADEPESVRSMVLDTRTSLRRMRAESAESHAKIVAALDDLADGRDAPTRSPRLTPVPASVETDSHTEVR